MNATDITKVISLILAISIAGERLITMIKTAFPQLVTPPAPGPPTGSFYEIARKILLMIISFLCCWLTATFLRGTPSQDAITIGSIGPIPIWLLGFLASGGSAFWTNLLGYASALKDLSNQKALQTKLNIQAQLAASNEKEFHHSCDKDKPELVRKRLAALKTVRFTVAFSGGPGTLKIQISGYPDLDFKKDGFQEIDLPEGNINYTASGGASPGAGGGATLTITGAVTTDSPQQYGPGLIVPNTHPMLIG